MVSAVSRFDDVFFFFFEKVPMVGTGKIEIFHQYIIGTRFVYQKFLVFFSKRMRPTGNRMTYRTIYYKIKNLNL